MAKANGNGEGTPEANAPDPMELRMATLSGDIRDEILREFKTMPDVWQKLDEDGQQRLIDRAKSIAYQLVDSSVDIVVSRGNDFHRVKVGKFSVDEKGVVKCEFTLGYDEDALLWIARHRNDVVALIARDTHEFLGERARAKPEVIGSLRMQEPEQPAQPEQAEHVDPDTGEVTSVPPQPQPTAPESHAVHG